MKKDRAKITQLIDFLFDNYGIRAQQNGPFQSDQPALAVNATNVFPNNLEGYKTQYAVVDYAVLYMNKKGLLASPNLLILSFSSKYSFVVGSKWDMDPNAKAPKPTTDANDTMKSDQTEAFDDADTPLNILRSQLPNDVGVTFDVDTFESGIDKLFN
eukprot:TRINITY_DN66180_c2_g2_i9.p1 TRINITY_DN66180_c2_g2~~TRINITY_DN66180_c2_g2_i9.p1  ORF type:complete len:157 (+),score=26.90 TRINITY_DN66180_c2_g2_i9:157-627(+)